MRDGATGTCVGRCCVAALTFAIYSMEISLKGLFWLASCPEFRFWTEQHIVEKNKPGPSGSCDVDGQCNSSGKPNCCLLSTVALVMRVSGGVCVYVSVSVCVHEPLRAQIQGPPQVGFMVVLTQLIAQPTQTTVKVFGLDTCVRVTLWFQRWQLESAAPQNKLTRSMELA